MSVESPPGNGLRLDRPVRLLADLAPPPGVPRPTVGEPWMAGPRFAAGMEAILGMGLFYLQLGYPPGPADGKAGLNFLALAGAAARAGVRVTVAAAGATLPPPEALAEAGVSELALDLTPAAGLPGEVEAALESWGAHAAGARREGLKAGVLLRAGRSNLRFLPGLLEAAAGAGADFAELPPLPLVYYSPAEAARAVTDDAGYRDLERAVRAAEGAGRLRLPGDLRVHDLLLWAILARRIPGAGSRPVPGCQAGAALAFVAPDGVVHGCQALEGPLGRVEDLAGPDFWRAPAVTALREDCAEATPGCRGCASWSACRGGCPGVRRASTGSSRADDPLCGLLRDLLG